MTHQKMNKTKKRCILGVLLTTLAFLLIAFFVFKKTWQNSRRVYIRSNAKAINAAIFSEFDKGNTILKEAFSSADKQWQFLAAEQYDRVITEVARYHNLDPASDWDHQSPLLDPWGNRFEVAYRQLDNEIYGFIVVSKGPDGIYGTKDDISSRNDIALPKN